MLDHGTNLKLRNALSGPSLLLKMKLPFKFGHCNTFFHLHPSDHLTPKSKLVVSLLFKDRNYQTSCCVVFDNQVAIL